MRRRPSAQDIERRITVRFTALIVAVLVMGIAAYAAVDTVGAEARLDANLRQRAERVAQRVAGAPGNGGLSDAGRIVDGTGVVSAGEQAAGVSALGPLDGFAYMDSPQGRIRVFAVPLSDGRSLQLFDAARPLVTDNFETVLQLLVITALVGVVTYLLGLRFSRRALAPVHESIARLERFTADAGHELRTPLASVRASLDVAGRTGDWESAVGRARVELDHASQLVDRLLELAHLDPSALRLESVDLLSLMKRIADVCAPMAAERSVSIALEGSAGRITADSVLLERLVMNLVTNALRFGERGSTVTVRFSVDAIEVHNAGEPIPADEISRIFEPFYQSERSRAGEGAGLGLAIAAVIAQAHGWSLGATSSEGAGTTFSVGIRNAKGLRRL